MIRTADAWNKIQQRRIALHASNVTDVAISYAVMSGTRQLEQIVRPDGPGALLVELLSDSLQPVGNPIERTYSVLCFEAARDGTRFEAVTWHEASEEALDALRAYARPNDKTGHVALVGRAALRNALELVLAVDQGDHYACLYRLEWFPALTDPLPTVAGEDGAAMDFYFPVRIEKSDPPYSWNSPFYVDAALVEPSTRIARVRDLMTSLETGKAVFPMEGTPVSFSVSKQPDVESSGRVSRELMDRMQWMYETDDHEFIVGVRERDGLRRLSYDALSFYTLEEAAETSGEFMPVGHAHVRSSLGARKLPDGKVVVDGETLAPRREESLHWVQDDGRPLDRHTLASVAWIGYDGVMGLDIGTRILEVSLNERDYAALKAAALSTKNYTVFEKFFIRSDLAPQVRRVRGNAVEFRGKVFTTYY